MSPIDIRALILDYGGVITLPQDAQEVDAIQHLLGLELDGLMAAYRRLRAPYDSGQVNGLGYWASVLQAVDLDPRDFDLPRLVQSDVRSWTHINPDMLALIQACRGEAQHLAIISNMTSDTLSYLRVHCAWLELFDVTCFSCELGTNKPGQEIYLTCLERLGLPPGECLFVDDSTRNVQAALDLGFHAIRFTSSAALRAELDAKYQFLMEERP